MVNSYATLTQYKRFVTSRGQTPSTDTNDDAMIELLIEEASRYLDGQTSRRFYPSVETHRYDIPYRGLLYLGDDLLELTTLTNGDATTVTSTNYILHPYNMTPSREITLKDTSGIEWEASSAGSAEQVISVLGFWGYQDRKSTRLNSSH